MAWQDDSVRHEIRGVFVIRSGPGPQACILTNSQLMPPTAAGYVSARHFLAGYGASLMSCKGPTSIDSVVYFLRLVTTLGPEYKIYVIKCWAKGWQRVLLSVAREIRPTNLLNRHGQHQ